MRYDKYSQPDTCVPGKQYYVKRKINDSNLDFVRVKFISYCPHPAEVVVQEGCRNMVIHRMNLYQRFEGK